MGHLQWLTIMPEKNYITFGFISNSHNVRKFKKFGLVFTSMTVLIKKGHRDLSNKVRGYIKVQR